ncbi:MAG: hypothetical protein H6Q51_1807 [Deltaproteobacteria bacterium]|nr:hypothetical protein [Deltaproteobacteria bacterium]
MTSVAATGNLGYWRRNVLLEQSLKLAQGGVFDLVQGHEHLLPVRLPPTPSSGCGT